MVLRNFNFGVNNKQTYQVVSSDGFYYNIAEINIARAKFTYFLRGTYEDAGDKLRIEFTDNDIRLGFSPLGTDLVELAESFEAGSIRALLSLDQSV